MSLLAKYTFSILIKPRTLSAWLLTLINIRDNMGNVLPYSFKLPLEGDLPKNVAAMDVFEVKKELITVLKKYLASMLVKK